MNQIRFTKNKIFIFFAVAVVFFGAGFFVLRAQENQKVQYSQGYAVDSDLDGLTDEGEKQIFKTDPNNPDTDGDGYFDGAEIINKTDPLNLNSTVNSDSVKNINTHLSLPWYITRATALISFFLLYLSIFFGLLIRFPVFRKIFSPAISFKVHAWLSVQALIFVFTHGAALLFDKLFNFSLVDILVPFTSDYETTLVALGTIGFYIMAILILTSYFRHLMSYKIWRFVHFFNILLYVIGIVHALKLGTDLKNSGIARNIFVYANIALVALFISNLQYRIYLTIKRKYFSNNNVQDIQP